LAACVFLTVLLNVNPIGIDVAPAVLEKQDREALQAAAWNQLGKPRRAD
jgi:hypothetical protein